MSFNIDSVKRTYIFQVPAASQANDYIVAYLPSGVVKGSYVVSKVQTAVTGTPGASKTVTVSIVKNTTEIGTAVCASSATSVVTAGSYSNYAATTASSGSATGPTKIEQGDSLTIKLSTVTAFTGVLWIYVTLA